LTRDATHDPGLRSWVESANDGITDFPIQNLPFGIFADSREVARAGVAIGDRVLDVGACVREGVLPETSATRACGEPALNTLMSLPGSQLATLRRAISDVLRGDTNSGLRASRIEARILHRAADVTMRLPAAIGDYTDFYSSVFHATNVGSMFRPDNPLLPNYKHIPIGYHGRSSSIVMSGTPVHRPRGQTKPPDADAPAFGPSKMLDYESELGFFVRRGNKLGETIPVTAAADHIFGFCLVNDWSARDVQAWEYQPLGPFLAKNFATTISPWVVTAEAVAPYRVPSASRPEGDPSPLDYLDSDDERIRGAVNAFLEVYLLTGRMRDDGIAPLRLSRAPFASMYWTPGQMLAHHASNGCNLRPGDLLASGTVSGDTPDSRGCLLELTWRGSEPLVLPTGETRKFLEDGDEVIMKGSLEAEGRVKLGFGECRGMILPAKG
jgi:fumarylacetoacetase